jgi:hypothetical protein
MKHKFCFRSKYVCFNICNMEKKGRILIRIIFYLSITFFMAIFCQMKKMFGVSRIFPEISCFQSNTFCVMTPFFFLVEDFLKIRLGIMLCFYIEINIFLGTL